MNKERLIFLTNDDSYASKGFRAAVELALEFGRVVAIAPDRVQSGMSQAITINSPLFMREVEAPEGATIYAFSGTPVDCAKIAFDHIFAERLPDLPLVITLAPVCRPTWLIEMECVAAVPVEDERFAKF